MNGYHKALVLTLALCAMTTTPVDAQESQSYRACFVPQVGAMYLLDLPGLPTACLSEGHEEIAWSEGGSLPDASVTSSMISMDAVDSTHIAADAVGPSELNVRLERINTDARISGNGISRVTISCTEGREVLSGGADPSQSIEIRSSFPSSATTWSISVFNPSFETTVRIYAVCADLG